MGELIVTALVAFLIWQLLGFLFDKDKGAAFGLILLLAALFGGDSDDREGKKRGKGKKRKGSSAPSRKSPKSASENRDVLFWKNGRYLSVPQLLKWHYKRTLKIRSLIVPWGLLLAALAAAVVLAGMIGLYEFVLVPIVVRFLIYVVIISGGYISVILWRQPDEWYAIRTKSLIDYMRSKDRKRYLKHLKRLSRLGADRPKKSD